MFSGVLLLVCRQAAQFNGPAVEPSGIKADKAN